MSIMRIFARTSFLAVIALHLAAPAWAQDHTSAAAAVQSSEAAAAKALANPLAALISVPMQYNYDKFGGANDGASVNRLNIQPVIPFSLNDDWNLISRTIVPFIDQQDFPDAARNKSGLGDITASLFFSPKAPTAGGWIWGVGPVFLLPTATQDVLGAQKWGLGPTGVALTQTGPWTVGMLANHIWGGAGSGPANVSATFLQPFVSYTTATTHTTLGMNTESTYDWEASEWSVPLNLQVGQVLKLGTQLLQLTAGARYWADAPANGTEGWGWRLQLTLLFPK
jgi:hypothetical protein